MRILCFGDSNTYGYDPSMYSSMRYSAAERWVDILAEQTGWEVINAGQNGRSIPHQAYETEQAEELIKNNEPLDLLIVMLGGNDMRCGASPEESRERMRAFLMLMMPMCAEIMLIAPPIVKRGTWVTDDAAIERSRCLIEEYRQLAEDIGVLFADSSQWGIELTFDGVHFTAIGHKIFAKALLEEIKKST